MTKQNIQYLIFGIAVGMIAAFGIVEIFYKCKC